MALSPILAALAARLAPEGRADIALVTLESVQRAASGLALPWMPIAAHAEGPADAFREQMTVKFNAARNAGPLARDLGHRLSPAMSLATPALALSEGAGPLPGALLTLETGAVQRLHYDAGAMTASMAEMGRTRSGAERAAIKFGATVGTTNLAANGVVTLCMAAVEMIVW